VASHVLARGRRRLGAPARSAGFRQGSGCRGRADRVRARRSIAEVAAASAPQYTVAHLCEDYWQGHVLQSRAKKGATEVKRMFDRMLGDTAGLSAKDISRAEAFDLIKRYAETAPVQAGKLRAELGAAWDYAIDAGRLPESCSKLVEGESCAGEIRSKGKSDSRCAEVGTAQRVLSSSEIGALVRWLPNFSRLLDDTLTLYLWTCTRGAEIVGMEGREIQREADGLMWWVIPKSENEERASRERHRSSCAAVWSGACCCRCAGRIATGTGCCSPRGRSTGRSEQSRRRRFSRPCIFINPTARLRPELVRARLASHALVSA
jgi:hypothetical protein